MTDPAEPATPIVLALHIEGDASGSGTEVEALPEVAGVDGVTTSQTRGIDVETAMTTLMMITMVAKNSALLLGTLDSFVTNVKKLAVSLGWKKVSVEVGRKTVDLDDLTPEQKQQLLEQALAQAKAQVAAEAPTAESAAAEGAKPTA